MVKRKWNNEGISGWAILIFLIIIALFIWQFIFPLFNLPSLTESIIPNENEVYCDAYIVDRVSNAETKAEVIKHGTPVIYDQVFDYNPRFSRNI